MATMALQAARTKSLVNMLVCRSVVSFWKDRRTGMGKGRVKYNLRLEVSAVEYGRGLYRLTERGNERGGRARAHGDRARAHGTCRALN